MIDLSFLIVPQVNDFVKLHDATRISTGDYLRHKSTDAASLLLLDPQNRRRASGSSTLSKHAEHKQLT